MQYSHQGSNTSKTQRGGTYDKKQRWKEYNIVTLLSIAIIIQIVLTTNTESACRQNKSALFSGGVEAFVLQQPLVTTRNMRLLPQIVHRSVRHNSNVRMTRLESSHRTNRSLSFVGLSSRKSFQNTIQFTNHRLQTILKAEASSSSSSNAKTSKTDDNKNNNSNNKKNSKKKKIKLTHPSKVDLDALTKAFDEMARKEGFDESTAYFADDATFEEKFDYDAIAKEDLNEIDDGEDLDFVDDDDDFLDFGSEFDDDVSGSEGSTSFSMEERIQAAQRDVDLGRVTISDEFQEFSNQVTRAELQKLGFKDELNPFGNDETPRKEAFSLVTNAMVCPACGSNFQCKNEAKPGYLPPLKYETQVKLSKIEEVQRIQEKAESDEWSTEDEIEWLIQSGGSEDPRENKEGIDIDQMAMDLGIDLVELTKEKKSICKRCHGLQNFGEAPEMLRPGWTDEPMLSQEKFRSLLLPLKEKSAVIVALVDLFDFNGSILPELDAIAGDNPVIIAANKADLLPPKMGQTRAENWVRLELEYLGVRSIANIGGAVRLVSCKTGFGISQMIAKARGLADEIDGDIYVVGAANAGKSTLINHILSKNNEKKPQGKKRAGNANARKGAVTASPLPGTTLEFIKVDLGDGQTLYDTPGLLVPNTLTQRLTPAELKMVVPKRWVRIFGLLSAITPKLWYPNHFIDVYVFKDKLNQSHFEFRQGNAFW